MKLIRHSAVWCALAFVLLMPAAPVQAFDDEGGCYACQMCHSGGCVSCGVMALNAISGCCGSGGGTTYCVPDYGGFAVNCDGGKACQCGMYGDGCFPLMIGG